MESEGRLLHRHWDLYDTRHTVFRPARMSATALEEGYHRAYRDFYRWGSIFRSASTEPTWTGVVRHAAYSAGWKKFEPLWDLLVRGRRIAHALPVLESVLSGFGSLPSGRPVAPAPQPAAPPREERVRLPVAYRT